MQEAYVLAPPSALGSQERASLRRMSDRLSGVMRTVVLEEGTKVSHTRAIQAMRRIEAGVMEIERGGAGGEEGELCSEMEMLIKRSEELENELATIVSATSEQPTQAGRSLGAEQQRLDESERLAIKNLVAGLSPTV